MSIAFIDLQAQRKTISDKINTAVLSVIESGQYILGPQVAKFEKELAAFSDARHAVGCANGTDALVLSLMALGVGKGDAVLCPSFTFTATAESVVLVGATPVFVDIDSKTYNISPAEIEKAIEGLKNHSDLKVKAIIAVDLFGQSADYPAIKKIADAHGLKVIADSAQGFGCTLDGKHPVQWADLVTTSFFPAKPLGCYGDGGAILTNDSALAEVLDSIRVHGKATAADIAASKFEHDPKYLNVRIGVNSRLDSLQAAILSEKIAIFSDEIIARNRVAKRYNDALAGSVETVPYVLENSVSVWAQYTVEHGRRDELAKYLKSEGVPTAVYYPIPMHMQPAYKHYPCGQGGMSVTEEKAGKVISLPMHPYLADEVQDKIIAAIKQFSSVQ